MLVRKNRRVELSTGFTQTVRAVVIACGVSSELRSERFIVPRFDYFIDLIISFARYPSHELLSCWDLYLPSIFRHSCCRCIFSCGFLLDSTGALQAIWKTPDSITLSALNVWPEFSKDQSKNGL